MNRPMREIAEAVSEEKDSAKLVELVQELCEAIDAESERKPSKEAPTKDGESKAAD